MSEEQVAIILINWNSYELTNDCINSLKNISFFHYDILVVDNNSHDRSGKKLKEQHPEIILIESETNRGFAGGNNVAINHALSRGYKYLLLLNNDTIVTPGFLEPLVEYMNQHPQAGAIQPRIFFNHDRTLLWNGGSTFNKWTGFTHSERFNKPSSKGTEIIKEPDWLTGCCLLIRADVIRKVGKLNEKFFMYYEDVDLSFRIKQAGYKLIYHPESVIYHIAGGSGKSKTKGKEGYVHPLVYYYSLRNKIWILKKYTGAIQWPGVFAINFFYYAGILGYFILRLRVNKLKATINAIFAGITGRIN